MFLVKSYWRETLCCRYRSQPALALFYNLENHGAKLMKCANTSKYMVVNIEPTGCLSMWMKSVPDK